MISNFERYKNDLKLLIDKGNKLILSMQFAYDPKETTEQVKKMMGEKSEETLKNLPDFDLDYQPWYSEALVLIKQLLPDRLPDFIRHYEIPKQRKEVTNGNYTIEDYLQGITITRGYPRETVVGKNAAIPHFLQQLTILRSVQSRFSSSLFDIRQLVQADLFDSELEEAKELTKKRFTRAAGALAGVVLEHHLSQVCDSHKIKITKRDPSISELNDILKNADVIEIHQWRKIQYLGDIRNLCDHDKKNEPTQEQVNELIDGISKIIKTIF